MPHRNEYIIVCGSNLLATRTIEHLLRQSCRVAMIVHDGEKSGYPKQEPAGLEKILQGDCRDPETLKNAGIQGATAILLLVDSDLLNVEAALRIREMRPNLRIVSRIFKQHLARRLDNAIADHHSLSDTVLAAPAFALAATLSSYAGYFYLENEADPSASPELFEVVEFKINDRHPLLGRSPDWLEAHDALLVVSRETPASRDASISMSPARFFPPFDKGAPLVPGDRVMVLARSDKARRLLHEITPGHRRIFSPKRALRARPETALPGPDAEEQAPGWRRMRHRFRKISPVTRLAVVLVTVMLILGIVVFKIGGVGGVDSLFFTVVVLTGGYGDLQFLQSPDTAMWLKSIASALTLVGAGLIGLIYGAMTEQVLGLRLGALLTDRKIPQQGHIIVCGLGQIGTRVVTELRRMGMSVVAIEQKADNPYIETVRRLDVPVIVASASAPGVLDRARVHKARCLVGATDDDLVNLDVALAARERRSDLRIVLRTFDRGLARPMRAIFGIDVTYSVWSLAAPAFAAAAIVGKTFGSFPWKDRAILVHEIHVQKASPLIGQHLEDICEGYDLRGFFRNRGVTADRGEIRSADRIVVLGVSDAMRRMAERYLTEGE